jgi:hypothetical protein
MDHEDRGQRRGKPEQRPARDAGTPIAGRRSAPGSLGTISFVAIIRVRPRPIAPAPALASAALNARKCPRPPSPRGQGGAHRQEVEAGPRQRLAALALQHLLEPALELVQIDHVLGGILLLRIRQHGCAPVGTLLLLGQVDAQHVAHQILQAVAVGIGAHQLGRHLGAEHRPDIGAEIGLEHGHVEARIMEDLDDVAILQHGLEPRRLEGRLVELHQMGVPVAGRKLHQAQPVARRLEAHGLGVDSHGGPEIERRRKVSLVELDCHGAGIPVAKPSPASRGGAGCLALSQARAPRGSCL